MKAVLVLDHMPGGCVECPLARTVYGEMMCVATERETNYVIGVDKSDWCPLREMPNYDYRDLTNQSEMDYQIGFNDCLRAIKGSEEDG